MLAQPNEVKLKQKSTLMNGDKGQKGFSQKLKDFVGKKGMKLTCFNFVVGKGLTLVTLVGRTLF